MPYRLQFNDRRRRIKIHMSCLEDREVNRAVNLSSLDRDRVWILFVLEERLRREGERETDVQ